jgi:putative peptidoglycan lipid II flippase
MPEPTPTNRSAPAKIFQTIAAVWRKYTTGSTDRQIFGAAAAIAIMTLLVKVIATIKELVVAWRFGTNDTLDGFLIAWIVPSFAASVIAQSLNAALIPNYIKVREQQGAAAAQKLLAGTILASILLLVLVTIAIVMSAHWYLPKLAPKFTPQRLQSVWWLLTIVSPTIVLAGVATIWGAVMNAGEKFALAAVLPLFSPAVTIALLVLFPQLEVGSLVGGLFLGSAIELTCLGIALKRQRIDLMPRWHGLTPELRQVLNQFLPVIVGQLLMSSTLIVDQAMASTQGPGSVAALMYGYRLISVPINLLVTALGTAVIPYFSQLVADENWAEVRRMMSKYLILVFAITTPICLVFYWFSIPITQILFERGSFTHADTLLVGQIQAMYAFQIPFYLAAILVVRVVSALNLGLMMGIGCVFNFAVNLILNYVFLQWMGLPGVALSTGFVYLCSWLFLTGCAYIKLQDAILVDRFNPRPKLSDRYVESETRSFINSALF